MFIALVGTRHAGKTSLENYLVSLKGFTPVRIVHGVPGFHAIDQALAEGDAHSNVDSGYAEGLQSNANFRVSFLSMSNSSLPTPLASPAQLHNGFPPKHPQPLLFPSSHELLDYVTRHWKTDFVTDSLTTQHQIATFTRRPFFMVVCVDAPLMTRFRRSGRHSLEEFVEENDALVHGLPDSPSTTGAAGGLPLLYMGKYIRMQINNSFTSLSDLYDHLDDMDITDAARLRPLWDTYFMTLATLASQRSNCMKRRVGAILVRDNRIVATGYNGTARGQHNCNEGGCPSCNGSTKAAHCLCLHAEENAILEAGRERVGTNAVLYSNTCPCLKCTIIIIQAGVKEVVYELSYKMDEESAKRFAEAGVNLRKYHPRPSTISLPEEETDSAPRTVRFSEIHVVHRH